MGAGNRELNCSIPAILNPLFSISALRKARVQCAWHVAKDLLEDVKPPAADGDLARFHFEVNELGGGAWPAVFHALGRAAQQGGGIAFVPVPIDLDVGLVGNF